MGPLSPGLETVLAGNGEWNQQLMGEWWAKRPNEYRAHKLAAINAVLDELKTKELPTLKEHKSLGYATRT